MRIYQGKVSKGDFIVNCSSNLKKIKVPRLVRMHADEMEDIDSAEAGDIVALFGVDCASGDTFTDGKVNYTMTSMHVPDAVISLAVEPKDKTTATNFSKALNRFTKEDPTFRVHRDEESGQTIISGMGELHLEIYIERMKREYNCVVIPGRPQVKYRETIVQRGEFSYTHRSKPAARASTARWPATSSPCPWITPLATSSSTTSRAAPSRASSSPPATRASKRPCTRARSSASPSWASAAPSTTAIRTRSIRRKSPSAPPRSWASARPTTRPSRPSSSP